MLARLFLLHETWPRLKFSLLGDNFPSTPMPNRAQCVRVLSVGLGSKVSTLENMLLPIALNWRSQNIFTALRSSITTTSGGVSWPSLPTMSSSRADNFRDTRLVCWDKSWPMRLIRCFRGNTTRYGLPLTIEEQNWRDLADLPLPKWLRKGIQPVERIQDVLCTKCYCHKEGGYWSRRSLALRVQACSSDKWRRNKYHINQFTPSAGYLGVLAAIWSVSTGTEAIVSVEKYSRPRAKRWLGCSRFANKEKARYVTFLRIKR